MSKKSIISLQDSDRELWDKVKKQGYIWVKTESGFITKDEMSNYASFTSVWYKVFPSQRTYGKTWALTKEELEK